MQTNFAIRKSIYGMLIDGLSMDIECDFYCMSYPHRLTHQAGCRSEIAAKPGGLYWILQGAFQDAEFESLQARPLSQ